MDEKEAARDAKKLLAGEFTLDDMLKQMKTVQRMGSISAIAKLIPGMPSLSQEQQDAAEKE